MRNGRLGAPGYRCYPVSIGELEDNGDPDPHSPPGIPGRCFIRLGAPAEDGHFGRDVGKNSKYQN